MKRYGNIYEKICTKYNIGLAHKCAKKDKSFYKEVIMVEENKDLYLEQIQEMLINKTYQVSPYTVKTINDKGKKRELAKLPYFPDRIIQWAIMLQIEPIFMETFTDFTCASLRNRGIHRASNILDKYMENKENTKYCLKIDVSKFYPSIDRDILKKLLKRKFKDKDLLELLFKIIDSAPRDRGIPIGSYLSQFLGNFYLSYFDHWLKEDCKLKYVIRYMDDVVILGNSKEALHENLIEIKSYLSKNLNLLVKGNWQVFPTMIRGIDFVGYRHFYGYKLLRKTTCKRYKKKMVFLKKMIKQGYKIEYSDYCMVNSYKGWLGYCDGNRLTKKYIGPIQEDIDEFYKTEIKKVKK